MSPINIRHSIINDDNKNRNMHDYFYRQNFVRARSAQSIVLK